MVLAANVPKGGNNDINKEIRMIKGDDGEMYESYDHPVMTQLPKADERHDS